MTNWGYTVESFPIPGELKDNLNKMGAQGWELIFIDKPNYIFKRQKPIASAVQTNFGR